MNYPEHEKLSNIQQQSQFLGEFMEYIQSKNIVLAQYGEFDRLYPINKSINIFLAEMFNIDLKKIDEEKNQMIEELRKI